MIMILRASDRNRGRCGWRSIVEVRHNTNQAGRFNRCTGRFYFGRIYDRHRADLQVCDIESMLSSSMMTQTVFAMLYGGQVKYYNVVFYQPTPIKSILSNIIDSLMSDIDEDYSAIQASKAHRTYYVSASKYWMTMITPSSGLFARKRISKGKPFSTRIILHCLKWEKTGLSMKALMGSAINPAVKSSIRCITLMPMI